MKVLQITSHFYPNIGGVETHLNDLIYALRKRKWEVIVLTYQPLTIKVNARFYHKDNGLEIFRIPWFTGLFYKLVSHPLLEFLYLLPGLFFTTPLVLILRKPEIIHAHGLVAGFVGAFWGKFFGKKVIISTHSIYNFPKMGLYRNFVVWIFNNANTCLALSKQSANEIKYLGIPSRKISIFTYWVDLKNFKKIKNAKEMLGWTKKFIVLFVGRLVPEKGIFPLLKAAKDWNKGISLKIIGSGSLEKALKRLIHNFKNIEFIGPMDQNKLPIYYSGADLLIVPSVHYEGFGRVILESLACETPVIGSDMGAIPEIINQSVGRLIDVSSETIKTEVTYFYKHVNELNGFAKNCRKLAERRYSENNVKKIIRAYRA